MLYELQQRRVVSALNFYVYGGVGFLNHGHCL
jgi:hypothetical protein